MFNSEFPYNTSHSFNKAFIKTVPCSCDHGKNPLTGKNCLTCSGTGRRPINNKTNQQKIQDLITGKDPGETN